MELSHLGSRIWYRGYIYAEQKINNKNRNKKTKDKRRSESVVLLGKEDEEKKKKKETKEENEGGKWKWRRDLVMLCGFTTSPGLIMRTVFTVTILDFIWRDSSPLTFITNPMNNRTASNIP